MKGPVAVGSSIPNPKAGHIYLIDFLCEVANEQRNDNRHVTALSTANRQNANDMLHLPTRRARRTERDDDDGHIRTNQVNLNENKFSTKENIN